MVPKTLDGTRAGGRHSIPTDITDIFRVRSDNSGCGLDRDGKMNGDGFSGRRKRDARPERHVAAATEASACSPESGTGFGEVAPRFSEDQQAAFQGIAEILGEAGIDLARRQRKSRRRHRQSSTVVAVLGKAGSGKTFVLAELVRSLVGAGVLTVSDERTTRKAESRRTLAILAPTNKAASVLRNRDVPATTIHRIMYRPLYDPEYEKISDWLIGRGRRPKSTKLSESTLDRVASFFRVTPSVAAAFAAAGVRTADFITGWTLRDEPLDIGFVDESSMLDSRQLKDLKSIFTTLVLFGDPAQLAPVGQAETMVFNGPEPMPTFYLRRIHRQQGGNPILDLAHALLDDKLDFPEFVAMIRRVSARDDRVRFSRRVESSLMARSPVLCWRNSSRVRLLDAFRRGHEAPPDRLLPGEPLICDGLEVSPKQQKRRAELEASGLIKGAQAVYLGPSTRPGFSRLHVLGAPDPVATVPTIIKIEIPGADEPFMASSARMGGVFLHGAACTIHKSQGSQWDTVQIYGPDLLAASKSGMIEADVPLWKRLAYVAVTRAERQLIWVHRSSLALPTSPLDTSDVDIQRRLNLN
ncbi:MAG: AAA family ATPase [Paracoccaceae bacterium]|nr:AAA family ATPase [Paracoccaceae bacterium]